MCFYFPSRWLPTFNILYYRPDSTSPVSNDFAYQTPHSCPQALKTPESAASGRRDILSNHPFFYPQPQVQKAAPHLHLQYITPKPPTTTHHVTPATERRYRPFRGTT
ncbi:uncharacterized protein TrAtP1_012904 [Trichoderma atroviride]|uniref:uncharacterized protein n=1 Tax=Hypocrea atroviridis TaxID=63577 RepID=UPI00332E269A|nr:hypothetical protein TrAtP1_012904 [Trichoderma atroviride]